jgi:hypothetical protein
MQPSQVQMLELIPREITWRPDVALLPPTSSAGFALLRVASSCSGLPKCFYERKYKINNQFLFSLQFLPIILRFS